MSQTRQYQRLPILWPKTDTTQYIKHGKPVIVPGFGLRYETIMPQSSMKWLLSLPEEELSSKQGLVDIDQPFWSIGHEKYVVDAWQGMLVKTEMNKMLEGICDTMNAELQEAFDDEFGTDTENGKEVNLYNAMQMIISRAAHRFTVGLPLGRTLEYINETLAVNPLLIANAGLVTGMPMIFRPISGSIFKVLVNKKVSKVKKLVTSEIRRRKEIMGPGKLGPDEPSDLLQMMLHFSRNERPHEFTDEDNLVDRKSVV